jgi:hypothetical protein
VTAIWTFSHLVVWWGLVYYENDGTGHFSDRTEQLGARSIIETWPAGTRYVHPADLDSDGDLDFLTASCYFGNNGTIAWYANDGSGQFGSEQVICSEARGQISVYAADLDSDGDLDILSSFWGDNKIAWYENEGAGQFAYQRVIDAEGYSPASVYAADLDGDGDPDVLSAFYYDDKIVWYENK